MAEVALQIGKVISNDIVFEVARIVSEITGVQLGERQEVMVQMRLKKRISDLGLRDEGEYAHYFVANRATEIKVMVSLLTTHHTYFFREYIHFEYLNDKALPSIIAAVRKRGDNTLRIWSAACSRGHEVYSLAMLLAAKLPIVAPDMKFDILGTDVDSESIAMARNGVFQSRELKDIPPYLAVNHWTYGTGSISDYVKVKPSLKRHCKFSVGNVLDPLNPKGSGPQSLFDVIFCRNVFIYFTLHQIKEISARLLKQLAPHGTLFIGTAESLNGLGLPVSMEGPSIYTHAKKPGALERASTAKGNTGKSNTDQSDD